MLRTKKLSYNPEDILQPEIMFCFPLLSHLIFPLLLHSHPSSLSFSLYLSLLSNSILLVLLPLIKIMFTCIFLHRNTCLSILAAPISVFCLFASEGPSTFDKLGAGGPELEELVEEFELLGFVEEGWLLVAEGLRF